jgi:hypothetical protein
MVAETRGNFRRERDLEQPTQWQNYGRTMRIAGRRRRFNGIKCSQAERQCSVALLKKNKRLKLSLMAKAKQLSSYQAVRVLYLLLLR